MLTIARYTAVVAVLLTAVAAAVIATIPYVLANSRIRDSIRMELSQLTGLPVSLAGDFSVSVLPAFVASISDVEIGAPPGSGQFGAHAKTVIVELSWLAALSRRVEIKALKIDTAQIELAEDASGYWIPDALAARISPGITMARKALSDNPQSPDFSAIADWNIRNVVLKDSRIRLVDKLGNINVINDLNADLGWPGDNMPVLLSGSGDWRGAKINLITTVREPLMAVAGGNTEFTTRLDSEPVQFEFDGIANLRNFFFTDGKLRFETPSVEKLLRWIGTEIDPGNAVGRMSMSARLTTKDEQLKFDEVQLELDGNMASGVLDLSGTKDVPALSGTLAFEELDVASFLKAFSTGPATRSGPGGLGYIDQFQLDLRLSAVSARVGSLALSNLAAAVRVKDGSADFDLGDATALGGRVQANLKISASADGVLGEMRLKADDIDLSQLGDAQDMPVIVAPSQLTLSLSGPYSGLEPFLASGKGEAEIDVSAGQVRNFDSAKFRSALNDGVLFNLPSVFAGETVLKSAKLKAGIEKGVAVVTQGMLELEGGQIAVSGALPFLTRGLALTGEMTDITDPLVPARQRFFVGGSWSQPFVTPIN